MDGAYLIWDGLLSDLSLSTPGFLPSLVKRLLSGLADVADSSDEQDSRTEAIYLWIVHFLEAGAYQGVVDARLRTAVIKTCCLHPGYWTQILGQRILDQDEDLKLDWQELFEASLLRQDQDQPQEVGAGSAIAAFSKARVDEFASGRSNAACSWQRAPLQPRVPIGVIA